VLVPLLLSAIRRLELPARQGSDQRPQPYGRGEERWCRR
jgi:hypothetical protein